MGLLESENGSLVLVERGDTEVVHRHKNFHLIGAMNPATDAGKRHLSRQIRAHFTELFVTEPDSETDLVCARYPHVDWQKMLLLLLRQTCLICASVLMRNNALSCTIWDRSQIALATPIAFGEPCAGPHKPSVPRRTWELPLSSSSCDNAGGTCPDVAAGRSMNVVATDASVHCICRRGPTVDSCWTGFSSLPAPSLLLPFNSTSAHAPPSLCLPFKPTSPHAPAVIA
jgi:hypothetical protein